VKRTRFIQAKRRTLSVYAPPKDAA